MSFPHIFLNEQLCVLLFWNMAPGNVSMVTELH